MDSLNRIFMSSACPIRREREGEKTKKEFKKLK
jgi:hypothetical protein